MNSLPNTVTRQHCDGDLNPGPTVPESSTLTTQLSSRNKKLGFKRTIPTSDVSKSKRFDPHRSALLVVTI